MRTKEKIGIIVMKPHWEPLDNVFYARIQEEMEYCGYRGEVLHYDRFFLALQKKPVFHYQEKRFDPGRYKLFFLTLFGSANNFFLAEALAAAGAKIKNCLSSIQNANDKAKTHLLLSRAGVPNVAAYMNFSQYNWGPLFAAVPEERYIVKMRNGSWGAGVSRSDSKMSLISTQELMASAGIDTSALIFQQYHRESAGSDLRLIIAGNKLVAAMARRAAGSDFRANLFSGGQAVKITPPAKIRKMAIDSIRALDLDYGGVDILLTKKGPLVLEVNANPGLKIERITKTNVARAIIKELIKDI